ncbi:MAG: hypothetical protein IPN20_00585 [Haliscomenobacter sp.]|nr:hypothetical protein [Haliscomenobacter sp.]
MLGYRKVPTDNELLGDSAIASEPRIEQVFVKPKKPLEKLDLERALYVLRKFSTHNIHRIYPNRRSSFTSPRFPIKPSL